MRTRLAIAHARSRSHLCGSCSLEAGPAVECSARRPEGATSLGSRMGGPRWQLEPLPEARLEARPGAAGYEARLAT